MLTIVYDKLQKRLRVNGRLARHSVETAEVTDVAGSALAAGEVCLHDARGISWAVWAVSSGEVVCDTRLRWRDEEWARWQQFEVRVKDGDGNLLGSGCVEVVDSCADHDESGLSVSGGPMVLEAGARMEAGCPVALKQGLAQPCSNSEHEVFVGIALGAADMGEDVEVQRWGAVWVDNWGLSEGERYWLGQHAGDLTTEPGNVALLVGIAQDDDTLLLTGGRVAVQPQPVEMAGGEVYARWSRADRRLIEVRPADDGGDAAAGKIPRLDAAGMLPPTMIPTVPVVAIARRVVSEAVRGISMKEDPTYSDVLEVIYRLLTALRTAAEAPAEGGSVGDDDLPEFRGLIDDSQLSGDTMTTWSSAKILGYIIAYGATAVKVLPDVDDEGDLPEASELERAAICYVINEGSQYWCSGPFGQWQKMESEAANITQVGAAIDAALEQVLADIGELQGDVEECYTKLEVDGLLDDKADDAATTTAFGNRYTKLEVDGLLDDKADESELEEHYYTKQAADARYDQANWDTVSVTDQHALLTGETVISVRQRGGVVAINAELHYRSSVVSATIAANQTLFVLEGVNLLGNYIVELERMGVYRKVRINADGSVVTMVAVAKTGGITGNSDPWFLGAVVACE